MREKLAGTVRDEIEDRIESVMAFFAYTGVRQQLSVNTITPFLRRAYEMVDTYSPSPATSIRRTKKMEGGKSNPEKKGGVEGHK